MSGLRTPAKSLLEPVGSRDDLEAQKALEAKAVRPVGNPALLDAYMQLRARLLKSDTAP